MVSLLPPGPFLFRKSIIGRFSIKEWTLYGVWRSFPISKVDPWLILRRGKEGFGGFEADRLRDRILSTQRFRRGRGRDFIYSKNVARARFGPLAKPLSMYPSSYFDMFRSVLFPRWTRSTGKSEKPVPPGCHVCFFIFARVPFLFKHSVFIRSNEKERNNKNYHFVSLRPGTS